MIKPETLKPGDPVAVLSPSWGGPSVAPHIYESGLNTLRELGLKPVEFPTARMDADELYRHPELRAEDINNAFADEKVKGIISTIGGSDSVRILKYLDRDIIRNNPKFLMGYSDFTTITTFVNQLGLVAFNGPSVMAGFSQWESFTPAYRNYLKTFLFNPPEEGTLPVFSAYSDGYPEWSDRANTGKLNPLRDSDGLHFLQGKHSVRGSLFGGCIEVMDMLKGTDFWPESKFWDGRILFLETSEDKPSVDYVTYSLRNYGVMGVFDRIEGLLIGRARDYSDKEKISLERAVCEVVGEEFGRSDLPIVANVDFGHTDPQVILPLGIDFEIDVMGEKILQKERAFS